MWIKWNQPRLLSIASAAVGNKHMKIVPGTQRVDDDDWNFARPSILDKLKRKELEEIGAKIETDRKGAKGNPLPDRYVETPFNEFDVEKQEEIINDCLSVECLQELKKTSPESLRILIVNQIEKMTARPDKK